MFIGELPPSYNEVEVRELIKSFGEAKISKVRIVMKIRKLKVRRSMLRFFFFVDFSLFNFLP